MGIIEVDVGEENSGYEYDGEHEDDLAKSYKEVQEAFIRLGQENLALIKEKLRLEALVESVQIELHTEKKLSQEIKCVLLIKEKINLGIKEDNLEK